MSNTFNKDLLCNNIGLYPISIIIFFIIVFPHVCCKAQLSIFIISRGRWSRSYCNIRFQYYFKNICFPNILQSLLMILYIKPICFPFFINFFCLHSLIALTKILCHIIKNIFCCFSIFFLMEF